ncbi:MAG: SprT family zinc-dependent metalloprotease [Bacteroidota bacterium]
MSNTLQIGTAHIPYEVVKTRGRRMRISFRPNAPILVIHTPDGRLSQQAEAFIHQQQSWILKHYSRQQSLHTEQQQFLRDVEVGELSLMGKKARIQFIPAPSARIQRQDLNIELHLPPKHIEDKTARRHYIKEGLRFVAKQYLIPRTHQLAQKTDSLINTVRIKDHKSKWGSCSAKSNINLNWHLILLDEPLIDYVIIHELMHLREMNHSARFWNWVAAYYPGYKEAEAQIKTREWLIGVLD